MKRRVTAEQFLAEPRESPLVSIIISTLAVLMLAGVTTWVTLGYLAGTP